MMELLGEDSPSPCREESAPAQEGGEGVVVCGKVFPALEPILSSHPQGSVGMQ